MTPSLQRRDAPRAAKVEPVELGYMVFGAPEGSVPKTEYYVTVAQWKAVVN